ncbi:MAG TPA: alpha/beta fold hydrolase, partial [Gemmatimonadaceae bacterium]
MVNRCSGWRRSAVSAAIALLLTTFGGLWITGYALSRPARAWLGAPPSDLAAETVRIPLEGGSLVIGWLARGIKGQGAVLLLHPLRANRGSMVERARFLRRAGYTVLLIDLPSHGESEGARITFGARESEGTRAALAYLRRVAPGERVGAIGASLGGASLLLGTRGPAANGADAVVLESVYPTIGEAVADRLRIRLGP